MTNVRRVAQLKRNSNPQLPKLPMVRTSERASMKGCEFAWDLRFNKRLQPDYAAPALRFGTLIHKALAAYYVPGVKRGEHPAIAFERFYEEDLNKQGSHFGQRVDVGLDEEKWVSALELGIAMMEHYIDVYGKDDEWEVIVTEFPFETVVYRKERDDGTWEHTMEGSDYTDGSGISWKAEPVFKYVGVLDGVWRHRRTKELWIPDHKTTAGIGEQKWTHLALDDQAGSYWTFGLDAIRANGWLKPNQQLHGMLYNLMRKALPDDRPFLVENRQRFYLNQNGSISKRQPKEFFKRIPVFRDAYDGQMVRNRAVVDFKRMQMFRSGDLEITKHPGANTCPMCAFRDACELHETGGDWEEYLRMTTKTWDPYAEHEVYDGR